MKIRWKEHPDMPSHLVDVILLRRVDEDNACPDDKMYTIESKVWTSTMKEGHSSLTDALRSWIRVSVWLMPMLATESSQTWRHCSR